MSIRRRARAGPVPVGIPVGRVRYTQQDPCTRTPRATGMKTLSLILLLCTGPVEVETQAPPGGEPDEVFQRADSLFARGEGQAALDLVLQVDRGMERRHEALWRGAAYAVGLGILAEAEGRHTRCFEEALSLARAARAARDDVDAHYWELAAMGRLALASGPRESAAYAERIREGALAILERDPDHAGAHHALGVVYREVMSVSAFARMMGRAFLQGEALSEASWTRAERHLEAAVSLDPDALLFRLDLARLHLERGNRDRARTLLEEVVAARPAAPPEEVFQDEARELLRGLA
jgi:regulator of microtubule dynamics protein 3